MKLFNSLSRQIEEIEPIKAPDLGMYTCGPTVYSEVTIGNWRTYVLSDWIYRTLSFLGFKPTLVMNITDVGHLTGDNLGDPDTGDDRLEQAAGKEGKTAWELAAFYTEKFLIDFKRLNLLPPKVFCKATDHIKEQITAIAAIESRGFAYKITDGIYFDTKAYETAGNKYGELSNLDTIKAGYRVEENVEKRDPRDFALWKFSPLGKKRHMEWDSPWGVGFPGWHIECSAMSAKYLGEQFDIHIGGEDLKSTHHPNEIAQAEAATGKKPFVKYWVHGAFLLVDNGRMGKSLGNAYTLTNLIDQGFEPMDLRYFYLTGHYRRQLNFTFEGLKAARASRQKLSQLMQEFRNEAERTILSNEKLQKIDHYRQEFRRVLETDLNLPEALAIVWDVAKSNIPGGDKYDLIREMDEVMGLRIEEIKVVKEVDEKIKQLLAQREELRKQGRYTEADGVRQQIESQGFKVMDTAEGGKVIPLN